jgi:hypothetical protein
VGHGFSYTGNWLPQFKQAYNSLSATTSKALPVSLKTDLPIDIIEPKSNASNELVFSFRGMAAGQVLTKVLPMLLQIKACL